jgi:iron-sulfur cluster assembly accessory protein
MITATANAVKHLRGLLQDHEAVDGQGLRLMVKKGGCAGMEYVMKLDSPVEGDCVFEQDGVNIIVDDESLTYLNGVNIDYEDSLNDSGFKVHNPNAARSCGCGSSFEPTGL